MNARLALSGVLSPVVTPFDSTYRPDIGRMIRHCRWLLAQNCDLAVFGTNSEANSLSLDEKVGLLDALIAAGIDPMRMMPGTGCCALDDTVRLTAHAVDAGCAGVLMLPPFYYKGVSDEGLFRSFATVIERVADARLRIYLYHIPPVSQVPLSLDLIERLLTAFPGNVAGIKDSSGDWSNTAAMLERQWDDFAVFAGNEKILLANMRGGGAGCISATANVNPAAIHRLYANWQSAEADALHAATLDIRLAVEAFPMIPALKQIIAHYGDDPDWVTVRPPLVELEATERAGVIAELDRRGFAMPGLEREAA